MDNRNGTVVKNQDLGGSRLPTHAVTRAMVNFRAHELAELANRGASNVRQIDYEQAKRDVTGETELDKQNAALDRDSRAS